MLNYIAFYLLAFLLSTPMLPGAGLQQPGQRPISTTRRRYPLLFGDDFRLHFGFVVALLAAVAFVWWLLTARPSASSSAPSARTRAPRAPPASTSGRAYRPGHAHRRRAWPAWPASPRSSAPNTSLDGGIAASIGFDAITVALLGRSSPLGMLIAGLLFGAFHAGGFAHAGPDRTSRSTSCWSSSRCIVLFIAAPPLVRAIFRICTRQAQEAKKRSRQPAADRSVQHEHTRPIAKTPRKAAAASTPAIRSWDGPVTYLVLGAWLALVGLRARQPGRDATLPPVHRRSQTICRPRPGARRHARRLGAGAAADARHRR